jgi:hypothetical protein
MALQIQGFSGVVGEVDGTTFRSSRATLRPIDYGALGHYRVGAFTGILPAALGANSEIFQFRWADATRICVITQIEVSAAVSTTFFAAGVPIQIDAIKSTGWTVQGTGGTGIALGSGNKLRTSMGASLTASGDIRIATTAALGAGTKTFESNSLSAIIGTGPITASLNGQIFIKEPLINADIESGEHPIVLVQNEGISVRSVAVPATGTWTAAIVVKWAELTAF